MSGLPLYLPNRDDFIKALLSPKKENDPLKLDKIRECLATVVEAKERIVSMIPEHLSRSTDPDTSNGAGQIYLHKLQTFNRELSS
jgi:hypothetical protein